LARQRRWRSESEPRTARSVTGSAKRDDVHALGSDRCVAIGNGRNDAPMLEAAALGMAVIGPEGTHRAALDRADVVALSIDEALGLLAEPRTLTATLRP
jgi:soluble P-type ATPase